MSTLRLWRGEGKAVLVGGAVLLFEAAAVLALSAEGRHEILGGDGPVYARYAENIVEHGAYSDAATAPFEPSLYRTPGYPLFLAGIRLIGGDSILLVRIVQFLLLGLLAALVYAIVQHLADRRAARLGALMTLTYLPFVWLARLHLTETLSSVLVAGIVLLLLRASAIWHYLLMGGLLGTATLVRPVFGLSAVVIAAAVVCCARGGRRAALLSACAVVAGVVIVLAPWTIRNSQLTDQLQPLGGGGGVSLLASALQYEGSLDYRFDRAELTKLKTIAAPTLAAADRETSQEESSVPLNLRRELAREAALKAQARDIFGELGPFQVLARIPKRIGYLWAVSDYAPNGSYSVWHAIARVQHLLLFGLALLGAVAGIRLVGWRIWPLFLFPLYLTAMHLIVHSEGRYSVPARPAIVALAALGVAVLLGRREGAGGFRQANAGPG